MNTTKSFQQILDQINQLDNHKIFAVLAEEKKDFKQLPFFIEACLEQNQLKDLGLLLDEPAFFPALSLVDNLFICSSIKDRQRKKLLKQWAEFLDLPMILFSENFANLTVYQQLKLQLLQLLLADKKKIILANDFSRLSIFEKQQLLPLLKELTDKLPISFLLLTEDQKIVESPYVSETFLSEAI